MTQDPEAKDSGTGDSMRPQGAADEWASRKYPVEEDMRFQRRSWAGQRIGWACMALLLAAGALGLFSVGPLSAATARADDGMTVQHQRFYRDGAPAALRIVTPPSAGGTTEIVLSQSLADALTLETIQPQPQSAASADDGLHLTFETPGADGGVFHLHIQPDGMGPVRGYVAHADSGARAPVGFFIYT